MTLTHKKEDITVEFLKENDGKIVWIRDDYLAMNGIQGTQDPTFEFLEHVIKVKESARASGVVFSA